MSILGHQPVEIAENFEGFVASTKRKFLYYPKYLSVAKNIIVNFEGVNYKIIDVP